MRRWLVTLALAVVALPNLADANGFRVELANRTVTTSKTLAAPRAQPRVRLPASVEVDAGEITVTTRRNTFRHSLGRRDGLSWIVTVGSHVVVGFAAKTGGTADTIVAIDHTTGRVAWKRSIDSMFAAELVDDLIAVERAGNLDVLDARTGRTLGTTAIEGKTIQAVSDLYVKTDADLIAIDRSGSVRWRQRASSIAVPTITQRAVIDAWIDRTTHRFGLVGYDPETGKQLASIDLGETGGWYDLEQVTIAPDGANDVLVSAMFAVE